MSKTKLKIVRAITDLPPVCYKLSTDGRKSKRLCVERQRLANWLALKGDPDGTHIYPGIPKMMKAMDWSHGKTCYILDDLLAIGCVLRETAEGKRLASERGTAVRRFNPLPLLRAYDAIQRGEDYAHPRIQDSSGTNTSEVQNKPKQESKIDSPEVQDTEQESKIGDQESNVCVGRNRPSYRLQTDHQPNQKLAAVEWLSKYYGRHFGNPLPISKSARNELQSLSDRDGFETFKRICKQWLKTRNLEGLEYPAGKLLEEYEGMLSAVQATVESGGRGYSSEEIQAAIDRNIKKVQAENERILSGVRNRQTLEEEARSAV